MSFRAYNKLIFILLMYVKLKNENREKCNHYSSS